jgi:hypothetical protein
MAIPAMAVAIRSPKREAVAPSREYSANRERISKILPKDGGPSDRSCQKSLSDKNGQFNEIFSFFACLEQFQPYHAVGRNSGPWPIAGCASKPGWHNGRAPWPKMAGGDGFGPPPLPV